MVGAQAGAAERSATRKYGLVATSVISTPVCRDDRGGGRREVAGGDERVVDAVGPGSGDELTRAAVAVAGDDDVLAAAAARTGLL